MDPGVPHGHGAEELTDEEFHGADFDEFEDLLNGPGGVNNQIADAEVADADDDGEDEEEGGDSSNSSEVCIVGVLPKAYECNRPLRHQWTTPGSNSWTWSGSKFASGYSEARQSWFVAFWSRASYSLLRCLLM
jgi:hypothetical protein